MAKKNIEEMNEQELAAEKAANPKVEVVSKASDAKTEHPMIRPEVKETIDVAPIAGGTINESGNVAPAPLNKNVQTKIDTRTEMQKRREENSKRWVDTIEAKEKELGRALTSQEIMDIGDAKGLWAYQALNNKGANWGNLAGGALVGGMNNDTYNILRKELDARAKKTAATEKENSHWNKEIAIVPVGDELVRVNKGMQNEMTTWGSQIKDPNYITPEQATTLYDKLQSYGIAVPKKTVTVADENGKPTNVEVYDIDDNGTSLAELVGNLGIEAQEVMRVLGFYDNDDDWNLKIPHAETFEEKLARRARLEEEMRLQSQQRELQRQKARLGLAELGAGIGDIIKASGGAVVDRRNYQDMYNQLTAQQQKNFDNYLARMQALKEQEKAKQRLAEERAYNEKLQTTLHERDMEKLLAAQKFQAGENALNRGLTVGENEKDRALKRELQNLQNTGAMSAAAVKAAGDYINIPVGSDTYTFASKAASDKAIQGLHGIILTAITDKNGKYKAPYSTIKNNLEGKGVDDEGYLRAIVSAALNSPDVLNDSDLLRRVNLYMTQASTGKSITPEPPTPKDSSEKVSVIEISSGKPVEFTAAEWDDMSPVAKGKYKKPNE